jgi:uncharacterized protein (TIGR04255 family)
MGGAPGSEILPSFEHPPVVEVAVGVHFLQLPGLNTVAMVRLADVWADRFPIVEEQPSLPPVVPGGGPTFSFQLKTSLPEIRLWLESEDKSFLVQIQHDRLLLNWRKLDSDSAYPRYGRLRSDFAQLWEEFSRYINAGDYGVLQPGIAEVTFFNRIEIGKPSSASGPIAVLNPQWSLDNQLGISLQMARRIFDTTGQPHGHQSIAVGYQNEIGELQMEISTRVSIRAGESSAILEALDEAHREGVLTFDHVTTKDAHRLWGKHNADNN